MNLDLASKRAFVGGASQGLGLATAISLASLGATVIIASRSDKKLQAALEQLPTPAGQQHRYLVLDMADHAAIENAIKQELTDGPIHILVNNAGGPKPGAIETASLQAFEEAFSMHTKSCILLSQLLLPGMKASQFGRIINITSTSVKCPIQGLGVSNTIRWSVAAWAKTLAGEVAKDGVTVNTILPGRIKTARHHERVEKISADTGKSVAEVEAEMLAAIPAGRNGEPSEVGDVIAFLASPAAAYVTGVALAVDGGLTPAL